MTRRPHCDRHALGELRAFKPVVDAHFERLFMSDTVQNAFRAIVVNAFHAELANKRGMAGSCHAACATGKGASTSSLTFTSSTRCMSNAAMRKQTPPTMIAFMRSFPRRFAMIQ